MNTVPAAQTASTASGLASTTVQVNPSGGVDSVTIVDLHVTMSDVVAELGSSTTASVTVYADTITLDVDTVPGRGAVIVAREIDVASLPGGTGVLTVATPPDGVNALQILAGSITGGTLSVGVAGGSSSAVPAGIDPLKTLMVTVDASGDLTPSVMDGDAAIADLVGRIFALNSFRAGFAHATALMGSPAEADHDTARSIMAWIVLNTRATVRGPASQPEAWADLHDQALPLLIELSVNPGTTYVPALSSKYYGTELGLLLDALDTYESQIASLQQSGDLGAAIAKIGGTLGSVATTEIGPMKSELASLEANLQELTTGINSLDLQFALQSGSLDVKWADVEVQLTAKAIADWFAACFKIAMAAVKVAFDVAKLVATGGADVSAITGIITETLGAAKTAYEAIDKVSKDPSQKQQPLLGAARALVESQSQLNQAFASSLNPRATDTTPLFNIDPSVAWDNYIAEASASLKRVTVPAAGDYLVALKVLANYGKAMSSKIATASKQRARVQIVKSQVAAAESATERWEQLEKAAADDEQRAAALTGVLTTRADGLRRTVFVSWTHFANSYEYLYFAKPPVQITATTSTAQLRAAVAETTKWVGDLVGDSPTGKRIELPNNGVPVELDFTIVSGGAATESPNTALYTPATETAPATLTWSVPMGTEQLDGVLPSGGNVAIWVTHADFEVVGATPNAKGNVLASISTSGNYDNGFGPSASQRFVGKSIVGDYGYAVESSKPAYLPWSVNSAVYMTPTPYTQWTMTFDPDGGSAADATDLKMKLTVNFRGRS